MEPHGTQADEREKLDATTAQVLLHSERLRLLRYIEQHVPKPLASVVQPQDVLQDVYVEAFRRIGHFTSEDETSVFRWLVTIARNHMSMLVRRHRAQKRGGKHEHHPQGGESLVLRLAEVADQRRTPSRSAAAHEFALAVEGALERLPASQARAIRLRYFDGLTPAEVARTMGTTPGAVYMLFQRGLQLLRQELRSASLYI
jgi:RNA polymerase sigma-70 factor (ECF subfamily)